MSVPTRSTTKASMSNELPQVISSDLPGLLLMFRESILSNMNGHTFSVSGIYLAEARKAYHNGVIYYDKLFDRTSSVKLTLYLHRKFRESLIHNRPYKFTGRMRLTRDIRDSQIGVLFEVTGVTQNEDKTQFVSKTEMDVLRERFHEGFVDVESQISDALYEDKKPSILILTGNNAKIIGDFEKMLKHPERYTIQVDTTNFSNRNAFKDTLKNLKSSFDYIAFVRGGGQGLEFFDKEEVCRAVLNCNLPFITAIGHESDVTILEQIADKSYHTPTAFGAALEALVQKDIRSKQIVTQLEESIKSQKEDHLKQLQAKEIENSRLLTEKDKQLTEKLEEVARDKDKQYRILLIAAAVVIVFLLMLLML